VLNQLPREILATLAFEATVIRAAGYLVCRRRNEPCELLFAPRRHRQAMSI
jgi:hypothetical protein